MDDNKYSVDEILRELDSSANLSDMYSKTVHSNNNNNKEYYNLSNNAQSNRKYINTGNTQPRLNNSANVNMNSNANINRQNSTLPKRNFDNQKQTIYDYEKIQQQAQTYYNDKSVSQYEFGRVRGNNNINNNNNRGISSYAAVNTRMNSPNNQNNHQNNFIQRTNQRPQQYANLEEFYSQKQTYAELNEKLMAEELLEKNNKAKMKTQLQAQSMEFDEEQLPSKKKFGLFGRNHSKAEIDEKLFGSNREEQEEKEELSFEEIDDELNHMHTSIVMRVVFSLVPFLCILYLFLSMSIGLPLPSILVTNKAYLIWTSILLLGVSIISNASTISGGILSFFKMKPNNDTYTFLTVLVCLIQSIYMALQQRFLAEFSSNIYLPVAAAIILFNAIGKLIFINRVEDSFETLLQNKANNYIGIADIQELNTLLTSKMSEGLPYIAYFSKSIGIKNFLDEAFTDGLTEDYSKIITPITFSSSILVSMIHYLVTRDILGSICILSGLVCITSPICSVIASQLPLSSINKSLNRHNTTICGYNAVEKMNYLNTVLLTSDDLFTIKNMAITDMKSLDRNPIDKSIIDAIACLYPYNNNFAVLFKAFGDGLRIPKGEDFHYQNGLGYTAWVNSKRVLVGTRKLMNMYGISLPHQSAEESIRNGKNEIIYIANSSYATAMIVISYCPMKSILQSMELLRDQEFGITVKSTDPSLTAEKIGDLYKYPPDLITIVPDALIDTVNKELRRNKKGDPTVFYRNIFDAIKAIFAAKSCIKVSAIQTAILLISVIVGFIMITFFVVTKQIFSLSWIAILGYQFIWLILSLIVPLFNKID